jgi:hypothetical protein
MNLPDSMSGELNDQIIKVAKLICDWEGWNWDEDSGRDRFAQIVSGTSWLEYRQEPWAEADKTAMDTLLGPHGYACYQAMLIRRGVPNLLDGPTHEME